MGFGGGASKLLAKAVRPASTSAKARYCDAVEDLITLFSPFACREGSSEPMKSIQNGTRPKISTKELEENLLDW